MLNWSRIRSAAEFQRLVNDLVGMECPARGFIPSNPYRGKDGGWDGYFRGLYPLEQESGLYSFQSKWTSKNDASLATSSLKEEIPKELEKSRKNGVDHLRILTNADLSVAQVTKLESLLHSEVKTLKVVTREDLERRISNHRFLVSKYFDSAQLPLFIPWTAYFPSYEPHLEEHPWIDFAWVQDAIKKVSDFLHSTSSSILLLHAPAGFGKSDLLREIGQRVSSFGGDWLPRFASLGIRGVADAIQDEIVWGQNKHLLIFDDCDKSLAELKPLIPLVKRGRDDLKVILACRRSGLSAVKRLFGDLGYYTPAEEIGLTDWPSSDLVLLLRAASKKQQIDDEQLTVSKYPNPYLISWIGRMYAGTQLPFAEIRNRLVAQIFEEARRVMEPFSLTDFQVQRLLVGLALLSPFFSAKDSSDWKLLGTICSVGQSQLEAVVFSLERAQILRRVGTRFRFIPDIKGEFFAADYLTTISRQEIETLLLSVVDAVPDRVYANIGAISRADDLPALTQLVEDIIASWTTSAGSDAGTERTSRLEQLSNLALIAPRNTIELMRHYLKFPPRGSKDTADYEVRVDDYGPVLKELVRLPDFRRETLSLVRQLAELGLPSTYGNYRPNALVADMVCPLQNTEQSIIESLDELEHFVGKYGEESILLLEAALKEVLAGSHEYTRVVSQVSFQIGEQYLHNSPTVQRIRTRALEALRTLLRSDIPNAVETGIRVGLEIGKTRMGRVDWQKLPVADHIRQEQGEFVGELVRLLSQREKDFVLRAKIENALLHYWALRKGGDDAAGRALSSMPRTPEYLLYRSYFDSEHVILDFEEVNKGAEQRGSRWDYLTWEVQHKQARNPDKIARQIATHLFSIYSEVGSMGALLVEIAGLSKSRAECPHVSVIERWVELQPNMFKELRSIDQLWGLLPEIFQHEVDHALTRGSLLTADDLWNEVSTDFQKVTPSKVELWICSACHDSKFSEKFNRLVTGCTPEVIVAAIHAIWRLEDQLSVAQRFELALVAARNLPNLRESYARPLSWLFKGLNKSEQLTIDQARQLRAAIGAKCIELNELGYHSTELVQLAFPTAMELICFIRERLERPIHGGYRPVPFEGLGPLRNILKTGEDNQLFYREMAKLLRGAEALNQYYIRSLIKGLTQTDSEDGNRSLRAAVKCYLEEGDVDLASKLAEHLPLQTFNDSTIIQVSESLIDRGNLKKAQQLVSVYTNCNQWTSTPGQPPGELVYLQSWCERMILEVSEVQLKNIFRERVDSIKAEIAQLMEEEILN